MRTCRRRCSTWWSTYRPGEWSGSIYVNGQSLRDDPSTKPSAGSNIASWRRQRSRSCSAAKTSGNNQCSRARIRMVAIHNRVLTPEAQIHAELRCRRRPEVLPAVRYLGDHITTVPDPYLVFEVSQFDSVQRTSSIKPRFISLQDNVGDGPGDIAEHRGHPHRHQRCAEAEVGQAWASLSTRQLAGLRPYPYTARRSCCCRRSGHDCRPVMKSPRCR